LLTVTGGKLTTFRVMALDALQAAAPLLAEKAAGLRLDAHAAPLKPPTIRLDHPADPALRRRLLGRYGDRAAALVTLARSDELETIPGTLTLWAELRWAARAEAVVHLDDLLLRRVRLGLLLPNGGIDCLEEVRRIVQPELGWGDARWQAEASSYTDLWKRCYHINR
jgi:glycerol-3-phosphate dehydrogenase